jgi:hypothetical protein
MYILAKHKSTSHQILRKIKNESERRFRLQTEIRADAEACALLCNHLCKTPNSNCLGGYVRRISQRPFGILFVSDIQVIKYFL